MPQYETFVKGFKWTANGGIEQGFMEAANQDGLLSKKDKERLAYLQSLPPNRVEIKNKEQTVLGIIHFKENED